MPELPEVETIAQDLRTLVGEKLEELRIQDARVWFESELPPTAFRNSRLNAIERRGKYLVYNFGDKFLVQHLRMTGKMLPAGSPALPAKLQKNPQIRLEFRWKIGSYYFFDTRRFGTITAVRDLEKFWRRKAQAPDPLDYPSSAAAHIYFLDKAHGRDRPIKSLLLDQTIIAGVGNIYADEALHRAKIHPSTRSKNLTPTQFSEIFELLCKIFREAIEKRGTSAFNYLGVNGQPGEFKNFLRVYQRHGENCLTCLTSTIRQQKIAGRTAHFCPHCQKLQRGKSHVRRNTQKTPPH